MWESSCSVNTQKTKLRQNETGLHQGDLIEKFKDNNLEKVSFLKLTTSWNVFIRVQLNQKGCRIFAYRNFVEKSTCKQCGFFDHQTSVKKSKWKQRRFSEHRNNIEKSTWEKRRFFGQQNYIEKVRGNDIEIHRNLVFNVSTK